MAPPLFADLGKATRDVFDKGYILDIFKLTAKTQTCGSLTMKTDVVHKFEDGKFKGSVEGTYPYPAYGLTFTKKWNTDNVIGLAAELANKIYPGVILKAEGTFAPDTGVKDGIYTMTYKHENVTTQALFSGGTGSEDNNNVKLEGSVVAGYEGWLAGARVEYDNTQGEVKNHLYALGHSYGNLQAFVIAKNLETYTAHIYQRVSNRLEMGITFGTDAKASTPTATGSEMEGEEGEEGQSRGGGGGGGGGGGESKRIYKLGARYLLNENTAIRAKVDNESMVGLGLESTVQGCVKLIFSCLIDGKKLSEGPHKFGLGVEIM